MSYSKYKYASEAVSLSMADVRKGIPLFEGYGGILETYMGGRKVSKLTFSLNPYDFTIRLQYSAYDNKNHEMRSFDILNKVTITDPNYGGERFWFVCEGNLRSGHACEARVQKLYRPEGELYFRCRHCHNIKYKSNMRRIYVTAHKLNKAKEQVKRKFYNGLPTRKYLSYMKKLDRHNQDFIQFSQKTQKKLEKLGK